MWSSAENGLSPVLRATVDSEDAQPQEHVLVVAMEGWVQSSCLNKRCRHIANGKRDAAVNQGIPAEEGLVVSAPPNA